jgi:hypothetical protein
MLKCAAGPSGIPIEEGRHGNDKWSRPRQERLHKLMHRYQICVALDERFGPNDVSLVTSAPISSNSSSTRCGSPRVPTATQCSYSLSQPAICGPPSSPAWPWFGKADTYQSRSRRKQRREDSVRSGWHKRRTSTTDSPVGLMTSTGRAFVAAAGDGPKVLWRSEG